MKIKNFSIFLIAFLLLISISDCKKSSDKKTTVSKKVFFDTALKEKVSYIIGHDIGNNLTTNYIEIDEQIFLNGLKEGLAGKESKYSAVEIKTIMTEMQNILSQRKQEEAEISKKAGIEFLEKNKSDKSIIVLPSGVQYKILKEGKGSKPKLTDAVKVNYTGKLIDGKEFDSSVKLGRPAVFPVNGVIKGWQEALQLMSVGSKWDIFIPAELAYGEMGSQGAIPPNSTLIFEVELLGIEPK